MEHQEQEIEIPTDSEMERIAADLHEKHVPVIINVLGWKVFYHPSQSNEYITTEIDPFSYNNKKDKMESHQGHTLSYCIFGFGSDDWRVCYSWNNGDDQRPIRIQEKGDVVDCPEDKQGSFFDKTEQDNSMKKSEALFEGTIKRSELTSYERNKEARKKCIKHYGVKCFICGINFGRTYGKVAHGFIHVHHIKPLSEIKKQYEVDPIKDLRPVCPNCHAVLHIKEPPFTIIEVQSLITTKN